MLLLLMKRNGKLRDVISTIIKSIILYYTIYLTFRTARSMMIGEHLILLATLLILTFFPKNLVVLYAELNSNLHKRYQFAYYNNLNRNFILSLLISYLYKYVLYSMVIILAYASVMLDLNKVTLIQHCVLLILATMFTLTSSVLKGLHKIEVVNKSKKSYSALVIIFFIIFGYMIGLFPTLSKNDFVSPDQPTFMWINTILSQYIYHLYICLVGLIGILCFRIKKVTKDLTIDIRLNNPVTYKKIDNFISNKIQPIDNVYKLLLLKLVRDVGNFRIIVENHLYLLSALVGVILFLLLNHINSFEFITSRFNFFSYLYIINLITVYRTFLDIQYFDKNIIYFIKTKYKIQRIVKSSIHIAAAISITFYSILYFCYFLLLHSIDLRILAFYFMQILGIYGALYVRGLLTLQNPIFNGEGKKESFIRFLIPLLVFEIIRSVSDINEITFRTIIWKVSAFIVVILITSFISKEIGNPHGEYEEII